MWNDWLGVAFEAIGAPRGNRIGATSGNDVAHLSGFWSRAHSVRPRGRGTVRLTRISKSACVGGARRPRRGWATWPCHRRILWRRCCCCTRNAAWTRRPVARRWRPNWRGLRALWRRARRHSRRSYGGRGRTVSARLFATAKNSVIITGTRGRRKRMTREATTSALKCCTKTDDDGRTISRAGTTQVCRRRRRRRRTRSTDRNTTKRLARRNDDRTACRTWLAASGGGRTCAGVPRRHRVVGRARKSLQRRRPPPYRRRRRRDGNRSPRGSLPSSRLISDAAPHAGHTILTTIITILLL